MTLQRVFALLSAIVTLAASVMAAEREANGGNAILDGVPEIPAEVVATVQPYAEARTADLVGWAPNGGVFIKTRFAETNQLHRVDVPGGVRQQLTFLPTPVKDVYPQPKGKLVAYTADIGGTEDTEILLFDPASGNPATKITNGARNEYVLWSPDGRRLVYSSTKRNGKQHDVWLYDLETNKARILYEVSDTADWNGTDWEGDRILLQKYVSITDASVWVLDVSTGKAESVASGGARYALRFGPEAKGVFITSDEGSEFNRLVYLPLGGGSPHIITESIPWTIDETHHAISHDRKRFTFVAKAGGIDQMYLLDTGNFKYNLIETPVGLVQFPQFSPDDRYLAMNLETARTSRDVFSLRIGALRMERWTSSESGGLPTEQFVEPTLVKYNSFDGLEIPAFLYKPTGKGPFPVVVSIHGGPEGQFLPGFNANLQIQMWIRELGVAVVAPNVRGSSGYGRTYLGLDNGFKREDSLKDIGALLDWMKVQPDLDSSRVALYGGSYGGYMSTGGCAMFNNRLRGCISYFGVQNFVTFLERTKPYRQDARRVEYGDERDPKMRKFLTEISPVNNAGKIRVPMLIEAGMNDPRVPASEAEQIVSAVRSNGVDVWRVVFKNEGHGFDNKENSALFHQAVLLFWQQHLIPARH